MKKKKDCKECGVSLKDWQAKQDYDLCLECYREKKNRPSAHEILTEKALEEEAQKITEDDSERHTEIEKEIDKGVEEIDEKDLGYGSGHLEDDLQGEEDDD